MPELRKIPRVDETGKVPVAQLGTGTATPETFLRGDRVWAVRSGSGGSAVGIVISIFEDIAPQSGTVAAGLSYSDMKVYALANNIYSRIRVRAVGYVFGAFANVVCAGRVEVKWGDDAYPSNAIEFRIPQTGTGDWFNIPYAIEISGVKTVATSITLRIWSKVGSNQFNWYVSNFTVEGIV